MTSHHIERRPRVRRPFVAIAVAAVALVAAGCTPTPPAAVPAIPAKAPTAPIPGAVTILGPSDLTAQQIVNYLCSLQPINAYCTAKSAGGMWKPEITPLQMAQLYIDEGTLVGVRGDIAFCQSILETGWFRWTSSPWPEASYAQPQTSGAWPGYVLALDHNYSGMGAYNGSTVYMRKPTPTQGVRAHLQHLRNYADAAITAAGLNPAAPFEPRLGYDANAFDTFRYKGQAPTWVRLNGKWAVPGTTYAQTFLNICNNIRVHAGLAPVSTSATSSSLSTATAADDPIYAAETQQLQDATERY